jgi:hypothetical protein
MSFLSTLLISFFFPRDEATFVGRLDGFFKEDMGLSQSLPIPLSVSLSSSIRFFSFDPLRSGIWGAVCSDEVGLLKDFAELAL